VNATPADTPGERASQGARRIGAAWRALGPEQRLAAVAAVGLFFSMFLPWYEKSYFTPNGTVRHDNVNAFGAFSFVEAAVLLVAAGVLAMLFARAERRAFHMPGGDGTIVLVAGGWAAALIVWRLFDKPGVSGSAKGATVGLQWGIFIALLVAGVLAWTGARVRAARRPEPPLHPRHPEPPPGAPVEVHLPDDRPHLDETEVMPRREPPTEEAPTRPAAPPKPDAPEGDQPRLPGLG
jgi:hypothetical protein